MAERPLRIAAHLGVKDEAALIGPCIAHLRAIGVAEFVVHDVASTDGTRAILRAHEGPGFRVIDLPDTVSDEGMSESFLAAVKAARADWVLMLDADEFPLPRGGDLRRVLAARSEDVVAMPRYNVALGPRGLCMALPPAPGDEARITMYARPDPLYRRRMNEDPMLVWLGFVPQAKVAIRPGRVAGFALGMHDALPHEGETLTKGRAEEIVVAHVAISDYPRFSRKVANIRAMFERHDGTLPKGFGWHWHRWAKLDAAGELRGEYDRSLLSEAAFAALRAEGTLRTAAEILG